MHKITVKLLMQINTFEDVIFEIFEKDNSCISISVSESWLKSIKTFRINKLKQIP